MGAGHLQPVIVGVGARDAAGAQETWITDMHAAAFKQASDDERALALVFLERWLKGKRD